LNTIAKYWKRWNLRKAYAGDTAAMNRLYFLNDPWKLDSSNEIVRFQGTLNVIWKEIGEHFRSILEVGCGEGLQTRYLASLADEIIGVDPSFIAIKRARAKQIANASFQIGDLSSYQMPSKDRFDLVTTCEVLYYVNDLEYAFDKLNTLARNCLVTYYQGAFERLDAFFASKNVNEETIRGPVCSWRVVYWRPE
jgi:2-polyprenyl-3-methyl-5-hydroxy-6-metoxy-1,4-benzoquinol methylase